MKYFFVLILFITSFSSYSQKPCEGNANISEVLNITFDYSLRETRFFSALPGVRKDRESLEKLNRKLYGEDVKVRSITDQDILATISPEDNPFKNKMSFKNAEEENTAYDEFYKESDKNEIINENIKSTFLKKLKDLSQLDPEKNRAINFSGHGVRCQTHDDRLQDKYQWCLVLPSPVRLREKHLSVIDGEAILNIETADEMSKYVVTAKELVDAYPAKNILLDACHTGQAVIDLKRDLGKHHGTFVFATSLGSLEAVDGDQGGVLFFSLNSLLDASDENLCMLDMDNDGSISQREAYMGIFINNLFINPKEINSFKGVAYKNSSVPNIQLPFSNATNQCFLMPSKMCEQTKAQNLLPTCESEINKQMSLNKNLADLFINSDKLSFLNKKSEQKFYKRESGEIKGVKVVENKDDNNSIAQGPSKERVDGIKEKQFEYLKKFFDDWQKDNQKSYAANCNVSSDSAFCIMKKSNKDFKDVVSLIQDTITPLFVNKRKGRRRLFPRADELTYGTNPNKDDK